MSEATLNKILKDCAKMEAELEVYKKSNSLAASCELLITYINSQPEPFSSGRAEPNRWHSNSGGKGCVIS